MKDAACHDALADAARDAVDASTQEMTRIVARVERLTDLLRDTAADVRGSERGEAADDPAARFAAQLDDTLAKIGSLFERQSEALKTFNIVLFGRTGAGKSTLISALTRSDGASVSQGGKRLDDTSGAARMALMSNLRHTGNQRLGPYWEPC